MDLQDLMTFIREIVFVRASAYEEWTGPIPQREQQEEAMSWLRRMPGLRHPAMLVAKWREEIIGYLWGYEKSGRDFRISDIGVRQDFKRQGIGRALLRRYEEACKSRGYQALSAVVYNRFTGMLILLLQEGFTIEGATWATGKSELEILLRKELGSNVLRTQLEGTMAFSSSPMPSRTTLA